MRDPHTGHVLGAPKVFLCFLGGRPCAVGARPRTCGMTSPARVTSTRSPGRMSFAAMSSKLWSVPVEIGGVTVSTATLHNFELIAAKDIPPGDLVEGTRAGEGIPQVLGRAPTAHGRPPG